MSIRAGRVRKVVAMCVVAFVRMPWAITGLKIRVMLGLDLLSRFRNRIQMAVRVDGTRDLLKR
jgi:hypothetical protein